MSKNARPNYRVIGYITGAFGLAVAGRNTIAGLLASDRATELIDIDPGGGRLGADSTYADFHGSIPADGPSVNVFHMNPIEITAFQKQWKSRFDWRRTPAVCVPFWELPLVPESWVAPLAAMDVILAPTVFVKEACEKAVSTPVLHHPQAVFMPEGIVEDRKRWGFPEDVTVFFVGFDPSSDIERKNPWAAVHAFQQAFDDRDDVLLVIRLHAWSPDPKHVRAAEELEDSVAACDNIRIMRDKLPYADVMSLYASCDVLVSTHRSEGLGLPLMEAMSFGKVGLATGWSGNLDFMNPDNSRLIDYTLVPMQASHSAYAAEVGRPGQVWAEPSIDHAAQLMRELAEFPQLRARLGAQAAKDMQARRDDLLSGAVFDRLEEHLANHPRNVDERTDTFRRAMREQALSRLVNGIKRRIVLAGRAMRLLPPGD